MIKTGGIPQGAVNLLGLKKGININSTADQTIAMPGGKYVIRKIVVSNASISLTLAAGGIYTAISKGGSAVVAAAQLYSALTAAAKYLDLTLAAIVGTDVRTETSLYFSLTTAQGSAGTADIYVYGDRLP